MDFQKNRAFNWCVTLMRIVIGWHFLYEGLWKIAQHGSWSCAGYLRMSRWFAAPLFQRIAENQGAVAFCNFAVEWGLTAIGLALILGVLARTAAVAGLVLLSFFYIAMPPHLFAGGENHFLFVNYNVIEAAGLLVVAFLPGTGFKPLIVHMRKLFNRKGAASAEVVECPSRRDFLQKFAGVPALGAFAGCFAAKHGNALFKKPEGPVVVTSPSYRFKYKDINDLGKKFVHTLDIGGFKMSRITLGGNLIGGWSHSRDLDYVATLMKAYNTERRIFDTMHLAEACGINTISTNPSLMNFIQKYWKEDGGTINFVSDCGHSDVNGEIGVVVGAKKSVDCGAKLIYIHGFGADTWAHNGDWKTMEKALAEMRKLGVPVGIGAHAFSTLKFCVEHDLIPDFWMKTFHPGGYWSAQKTPQDTGEGEPGSSDKTGWHDNNWCRDPAALSAWFQDRPEPWIAFKTMAAGAVHPRQSIPFVFNGGADAACMGMFDFQVVEDVNLANDAFDKGFKDRKRAWVSKA